jgi:S-methylmethionine-dependent homocysteine/selenocysteine methylase
MQPLQFASFVPALVEAGANFIGGCCGTTPQHIAALRKAADAANKANERAKGSDKIPPSH